MQQWKYSRLSLTLFDTGGGGIFILLALLDQILSAEIFQKFPNFFGGKN